MNIKTASDLKRAIGDTSYFFTRATMNFFGDTMANYKLTAHADYFELKRKRPVKYGLSKSAYFDKNTLSVIYPTDQDQKQ